MGNCTISVLAYADDLLLVSETKEGLQRLFNVVGDFCQFSGLKLNMGKDKTAWMQANGVLAHSGRADVTFTAVAEVQRLNVSHYEPRKSKTPIMAPKRTNLADVIVMASSDSNLFR